MSRLLLKFYIAGINELNLIALLGMNALPEDLHP